MLTPIKTTQKTNCFQRINNLLHSDSSSSTETDDQLMELAQNTFKESTDYRKVYKNFDYSKTYDTWIYEGNDADKIVGYKYLQSYPYDKPQFKIGDYIHWNFNHTNLSTWILTSLDTEYLYDVKGRMLECNNSLRWIDKNGEINCYPCVIKDALTYTNFRWGSKGVVENSGDIVVVVQKNEDTEKLEINDRFLFNQVGFRVKQFFDELNPNYMEIYMMKSPELSGDDFVQNIAINDTQNEKVDYNGIVILPNIKEILLNDNVEFSIYNYNQGIKSSDTFSIEINGVPVENYEIEIIDGNNFKIKNLKQYQISPMIISYTNNTTEEIGTKQIWLGGNW